MVPPISPHSKTPSASSPTSTSASIPTSRVPGQQQEYSCILCKQRKVRCDRGNPCSGCVRAGVDCVPGVRQPYKRRKRIHHHHHHHQQQQQQQHQHQHGDTDNSARVGDFYSTPSARVLDNRPTQEEPRSQQPQIPSFGQYARLFLHFTLIPTVH